VVTGGGRLHASYVIHTVGPVWRGGTENEEGVLASAFKQSLKRAQEKGVKTIAFPAISTGAYGFPADLAAKVSLCAVKEYLVEHPDVFEEIRLVLFNQRLYEAFEKAFLDCFRPS
jgi:O-acetyl-ADP-ribose deacetylase (regulator of RNase III)